MRWPSGPGSGGKSDLRPRSQSVQLTMRAMVHSFQVPGLGPPILARPSERLRGNTFERRCGCRFAFLARQILHAAFGKAALDKPVGRPRGEHKRRFSSISSPWPRCAGVTGLIAGAAGIPHHGKAGQFRRLVLLNTDAQPPARPTITPSCSTTSCISISDQFTAASDPGCRRLPTAR